MRLTIFASLHKYQHLSRGQLKDPYDACKTLFRHWFKIDWNANLDDWFESIVGNKVWPEAESAYLMSFADSLMMAVEIASLIRGQGYEHRVSCIKKALSPNEIYSNPALWCENESVAQAYMCYPRHLSPEEIQNPFLVFVDFFKGQFDIRYWKKRLYIFMLAAQTQEVYIGEIDQVEYEYSMVSDKRLLSKLIDALYIIYVREFIHNPKDILKQIKR